MTAVIPKEKGNPRSQLRKKVDTPGLRIFRHATGPRFCKRGYGEGEQARRYPPASPEAYGGDFPKSGCSSPAGC